MSNGAEWRAFVKTSNQVAELQMQIVDLKLQLESSNNLVRKYSVLVDGYQSTIDDFLNDGEKAA